MTSNTIHDKFIVYDVIAKLLVKEIQKWSESNKLEHETINDKRLELFRFVLTTDFDMQMGRLNESDYVSINLPENTVYYTQNMCNVCVMLCLTVATFFSDILAIFRLSIFSLFVNYNYW
jgi:hypothetical protein